MHDIALENIVRCFRNRAAFLKWQLNHFVTYNKFRMLFIILSITGADLGFPLMEGVQNILCAQAHHERKTWVKSPGSSRGFLFMLSRAILALFLNILIQNGIKQKRSRSKFRGNPSGSATVLTSLFNVAICYCLLLIVS